MLKKLIHTIFLSCSEATLLMEKRNAKNISSKENWKLSVHIKICKWCRTYQEKLGFLDNLLKRKLVREENTKINKFEIQIFKEKICKNLNI